MIASVLQWRPLETYFRYIFNRAHLVRPKLTSRAVGTVSGTVYHPEGLANATGIRVLLPLALP